SRAAWEGGERCRIRVPASGKGGSFRRSGATFQIVCSLPRLLSHGIPGAAEDLADGVDGALRAGIVAGSQRAAIFVQPDDGRAIALIALDAVGGFFLAVPCQIGGLSPLALIDESAIVGGLAQVLEAVLLHEFRKADLVFHDDCLLLLVSVFFVLCALRLSECYHRHPEKTSSPRLFFQRNFRRARA